MRNSGIDNETMGLGLTISTFMTVSAMAMGGQLARYASNRAMLLCVLPAFAVLIFAYLTSQSPLWFYLAIIPMGFAFGITDLFMNAEATAIEYDMRRPVFTAFHGCVSLGVASVAIAASFISTMVGTWATALLAVGCFALAWVFIYFNIKPRQLIGGRSARIGSLPNKLPLILLGTAAGLIIAGETAALLWSAKLLDELAPSLAAIAGLGAAFYGALQRRRPVSGRSLAGAVRRCAADDRLAACGDCRIHRAGPDRELRRKCHSLRHGGTWHRCADPLHLCDGGGFRSGKPCRER